MADGELTAQAARELAKRIPYPGFDVLFDHGDSRIDSPHCVGNISSWFGDTYSSKAQLAFLDIAVVDRHSEKAIVLVEIEETSSNPKVAIGDAFGTILGDHITFQGARDLTVGDYTALLILLRNGAQGHLERLRYLQEKISMLSDSARCGNSAVSRIEFDLFREANDLFEKLSLFVNPWVASYSASR